MPDIRLQAQPFVHCPDRSIAGVGGGVHIRIVRPHGGGEPSRRPAARWIATAQSEWSRRDLCRSASCLETVAASARDGLPRVHRLALVGSARPRTLGSTQFRRQYGKRLTSRIWGKSTDRHSFQFHLESLPHLEETLRKRGRGHHDAFGSRGNDTGRRDTERRRPRFGHYRRGTRP